MACSPMTVAIIMGCRSGVAVYKREFFRADGSPVASLTTYSDGGNAVGWTPGNCPA